MAKKLTVEQRLAALEKTVGDMLSQMPKDGEPGQQGEPGPQGEQGRAGVSGPTGKTGEKGEPGKKAGWF